MEMGELEEAEEELAERLRDFPRFALLRERLARAALMRGRGEEAREHLAKAAEEGWIFSISRIRPGGGLVPRGIY